jgi:Tat protein secretion system quality control protein TatD with DNase activity
VNVKVGEEKEINEPPVSETDSPDCTVKGMVRVTVYVTPRSKGNEKYTVKMVGEFVTELLEITEN